MKVLEITAIVDEGQEWPSTGPLIDGQNVCSMILATFADHFNLEEGEYGSHRCVARGLTFMVGTHVYTGDVVAYEGDCGYSEVTDWIADEMLIGGVDLLGELQNRHGQLVTLRVDDGPRPQG